jgi:hypothetical protein
VVRTLNALEVCGLLAMVARVPKTPAPISSTTPQPAGGIRNLLRLMRKRLGLSEDA